MRSAVLALVAWPAVAGKCCWSKWGDASSCGKYPSDGHGAICGTDGVTKCTGDAGCPDVPPGPTPAPTPAPPPLAIYVSSKTGSDSNSGISPSSPFRSIAIAVAAAPRLKASTILLSGRFYLNQTVTLNSKYKGLVIEQWSGQEDAILSGGVEIPSSAWQKYPGGVWSAPLTDAAANALAAQGSGFVFVNGNRRSIVRTKTMHWSEPLGPKQSEISKWGFTFSEGDINASWSLKKEHLSQWRVATFHSWTKAYHTVADVNIDNRTMRFAEVASFGYGDYIYCSEKRYYIEGIPELPLTPGSWRMEPSSNGGTAFLLYKPLENEQFPGASVVVPVLSTIFATSNAPSVTFRNFAIENTFGGDCGHGLGIACDRDNAMMATSTMMIESSPSVHISNVILRNAGGTAITVRSSAGVVIEHVGILDSGAMGITVTSSDGSLVNNSFVQGYGIRFPAATGINLVSSRNATVSHCDISGGFYAGLSGGGVDDAGAFSAYTFNHIHDIGSEKDDGLCDFGAYHGANHGSVLPIYITSNILHGVTAYANGGSGIYMDVSSAAYQVSRNLIYDVSYSPILWNINPGIMPTQGPTPTRINNNVLIANRDNKYYRSGANGTRGYFRGWGLGNPVFGWIGHTTAELERNAIVIDAKSSPSRGEWFGGRPCAKDNPKYESANCTWDFDDNFKQLTSGRNVWFNQTSPSAVGGTSTFPGGCSATGKSSWKACGADCSCRTLSQWKGLGNEESSLWVDPKLTGALKLVSEPRALALGIQPLLELSKAGADWKLLDARTVILI